MPETKNAENRYLLEPADEQSPDRLFQRPWAMILLEQAVQRLEKEYHSRGKVELYEQIRSFLAGGTDADTYGAAAARLGMTENTLKTQVRRLRLRNRELLREVVADTVASPQDIAPEIQELFAVLAQG